MIQKEYSELFNYVVFDLLSIALCGGKIMNKISTAMRMVRDSYRTIAETRMSTPQTKRLPSYYIPTPFQQSSLPSAYKNSFVHGRNSSESRRHSSEHRIPRARAISWIQYRAEDFKSEPSTTEGYKKTAKRRKLPPGMMLGDFLLSSDSTVSSAAHIEEACYIDEVGEENESGRLSRITFDSSGEGQWCSTEVETMPSLIYGAKPSLEDCFIATGVQSKLYSQTPLQASVHLRHRRRGALVTQYIKKVSQNQDLQASEPVRYKHHMF